NAEVAWVGGGQTATFKAPAGRNTIMLLANREKRTIYISAYKNVAISAKWNRRVGGVDAICTGEDVVLL
ncbi:MAG: hypothetical protein RR336_10410, partial [Oscillospiraceae bacterium]